MPISKLLRLLAEDEKNQAEAMIKTEPGLLLQRGDVTDLSGRKFENITAFQYAVWALDWHMWTMIQKYLPPEEQKAQARQFETGAWVVQYGITVSSQNLNGNLITATGSDLISATGSPNYRKHVRNPNRYRSVPSNDTRIDPISELLVLRTQLIHTLSLQLSTNDQLQTQSEPPINWLEKFKQAIDHPSYEDAKMCLENGLAINSVIHLNERDRNLFEYAIMQQPNDLGFASLVLYFDRLRNNDYNVAPVITASMIEDIGRDIRGAHNEGEFIRDLQQRYLKVMGSFGPLAPLTPIDRLLDVTHALTQEQQQRAEIKLQFKDFYERIYNRLDFRILLKLAALATHGIHRQGYNAGASSLWERQFKVFADPNSIYTDNLYLTTETNSIISQQIVGLQSRNHVFLGLKERNSNTLENISILLHEITHFIAREVYDNNTTPYKHGDADKQNLFDRIREHIKNSGQNKTEFTDILNGGTRYQPTQYHAELIARTTEYLWNRQDPQIAKNELQKLCSELHDFYFDTFLPNCANHYRTLMGGYIQRNTVQQTQIAARLVTIDTAMIAQNNTALEIERQFLIAESKQIKETISAIQNHPDYLYKQQKLPVENEVGQIQQLQITLALKDEKIERLEAENARLRPGSSSVAAKSSASRLGDSNSSSSSSTASGVHGLWGAASANTSQATTTTNTTTAANNTNLNQGKTLGGTT